MKPTLDLYIGHYISDVLKGEEPWQWGIRLDNGVEIRNKDRREVFTPERFVGAKIQTVAYSEKDTTIFFSNGQKWSLNPTQYAIHDPVHGGEAYPQWPEELEEAGIPSHPEEEVSTPPSADWDRQRKLLEQESDARVQSQADDWLEEDQREQS